MLERVSLETLQKIAVYGGFASVSGGYILHYLTKKKISSGAYYTDAVAALKKNKRACAILGRPLKIKFLSLGDKENWANTEQAQVVIPVIGSRTSGVLKSNASFRNGMWELDSLTLRLNNDELEEINVING